MGNFSHFFLTICFTDVYLCYSTRPWISSQTGQKKTLLFHAIVCSEEPDCVLNGIKDMELPALCIS